MCVIICENLENDNCVSFLKVDERMCVVFFFIVTLVCLIARKSMAVCRKWLAFDRCVSNIFLTRVEHDKKWGQEMAHAGAHGE